MVRDLPVVTGTPLVIDVAPGAHGLAVLNGMQILSRGTSPPRLGLVAATPPVSPVTNLIIREVKYEGRVSDHEARFQVMLDVESLTANETASPLFDGEVALVVPKLPPGVRILSAGGHYQLWSSAPGRHAISLELVAKISRLDPWNQVSFTGPPAAITSVQAQAAGPGVEMELLSGTQLETEHKATSRLIGFLGGERAVVMRWQSKAMEVMRKSLVTVDTVAAVVASPTVVRFTTEFRYAILQAPLRRVTIAVPASQTLTKLAGDQIRDWQVEPDGTRQLLTVEFITPVEKHCVLSLQSEQSVAGPASAISLVPPQPLGVERESGSLAIAAEDTLLETSSAEGLRQVNASDGGLAAYRFHGRPIALTATLQRIEPLVRSSARVTVQLEEARVLITHALSLSVERSGIYSLELVPQAGFAVSDVRGEGVEDWKLAGGTLRVAFTNRLLGARALTVRLEQAFRQLPDSVVVTPLIVAGATNLSVQIGAAALDGMRFKTGDLAGLREIPASLLPARGAEELLAFTGDPQNWKLTLATERLAPRVIAEVFNLITIGDGLVGGSATLRYGIFNQGVQEFRVGLPAHWRNVEFTGPNIRRKDRLPASDARVSPSTNEVTWLLTLQEKAWGAYTLVVTYDYQFDPKGARLDLAGAHTLGVERESGSAGVMSVGGLQLQAAALGGALRRVDEADLAETDRALATRPLQLSFKYSGSSYALTVQATRFEQISGLEAIADRTELTSVLNEQGQMLTQASFMVKNNEKQFIRFMLPAGSELWSSYVNSQPAKPEQDGDGVLVPLPRQVERDQAFAVDIVYAQKINFERSRLSQALDLKAPMIDLPNTYAEWQLYVPISRRLGSFGGNMMVAPFTTYGMRDAWRECVAFWGNAVDRNLGRVAFASVVCGFVVLVALALRRGAGAVMFALVSLLILSVLAGMMLPALAKAKAKAQRINAASNLKQIGLAARMFANDHGGRFPVSFEEMKTELTTDKILVDPATGQRFTWIGAGKFDEDPTRILAYSQSEHGGLVALADGSVAQVTNEALERMLREDARRPLPGVAGLAVAAAAAAAPADGGVAIEQARLGGAAAKPSAPAPESAATPRLTGIRPIRIDVPRLGRAFTFTKVLNAGHEPLAVRTSVMRNSTFRILQMLWQTGMFLSGLGVLWLQWRRRPRSTFWLTIGSGLVCVSVAGLLLMWRALGLVLITLPPLLILVAVVWLIARLVPRKKIPGLVPPIQPQGPVPTVATLIALLLSLGSGPGGAEDALASSATAPPLSSRGFSISSANYTGTVGEKVAEIEATLHLATSGTNQSGALFGEDVAVRTFEVQSGNATLLREGRGVRALLPQGGDAELRLRIVAKVGGEAARRRLAFTAPPALSSTLSLKIDEAEADVEFPTAVAFTRTNVNRQTLVTAVLGSSGRVEMTWTPRVKRSAEIAATVFAHSTALVTFGSGVVNTRAMFDYQITQGELRRVRWQLPASYSLQRVQGEGIRNWELGNDAILTVELARGVSPSYRLTLELERVLEKLPAAVRVELPHPLEVKRGTGLVAVRGTEELALSVEALRELQRVDVEEFVRAAQALEPLAANPRPATERTAAPAGLFGCVGAFRFSGTDFELAAKVEEIRPQLDTVVRNKVRIGFDAVRVSARVEYAIQRAGVFGLRLALPGPYKVESVNGTNVQQWVEKAGPPGRVLEVALKERTIGPYLLEVELVEAYQALPKTIAVTGVRPLDTQKQTGFVTVASEVGVAAKVDAFDGLTEVPTAAVGWRGDLDGATAMLAFKLAAAEPSVDWKLTVSTETVEPWVRAEVANYLMMSETLISGHSTVRYDIANAPVKEFRVRVPAVFRNVEIAGANIRRRDEQGEDWRVELQSRVRGTFTLNITWEMEQSAASNRLDYTGIQATNVERETGYVIVATRPAIQVNESALGELLTRIDFQELPPWVDRPTKETALAFKYLRPGYRLALEVKRHGEAEVLAALIESARFTTVVADDGQVMTEMSLTVRNNGRQHLEVELPGGNPTVWSAFLAGEPVRPNVRNGKLMLAMERNAEGAPLAIDLIFVSTLAFPARSGAFSLEAPRFDVPVKNARWELFLPPDYDYSDFDGGSMTKVAESAPVVQMFSVGGYLSQQSEKAAAARAERTMELSSVQSNLRGGNVKEALTTYNRAKNRSSSGQAQSEILELQEQVRRVQSGNLIEAQRHYFNDNNARFKNAGTGEPSQVAGTKGEMTVDYDAKVAELQWSRLEAAQRVAQPRVAPLHINLPTRGVKLVFSQVLQTEIRKPMTVKFRAESNKDVSWLKTMLWSALGLVAFSLVVGGINRAHAAKASMAPLP